MLDFKEARRLVWSSRVVLEVGDGESGGEDVGEVGREVCTPISRWNISVGSSSLLSSSSLSLCTGTLALVVEGISETIVSNLEISFWRLVDAVEERESRDSVREVSIGVTR